MTVCEVEAKPSRRAAIVNGFRVLVIEDDADFRGSLAELVQREGFTVSEAASLEEARTQLADAPDIVFLDLGNVNWIPVNDPVNALVHTEDGSAVHSVMVGGRMVLENRKLVNVDLAKLAREAENARERLERLNRDNKALYERLEPVVGSFCPALAKQPLHINRYAAWR